MATNRDRKPPPRPPATTLKAREDQLIAAAVDLAEKQIREGKASSQVITHFLKLGSTREKLEQSRLEADVKLVEAKVEGLVSATHIEELYSNAIAAMKRYQGRTDEVIE